jgi:hypothetical protein
MNGADKNGDITSNHQNGGDKIKQSTLDKSNNHNHDLVDHQLYHEKAQTKSNFSCCQKLSYHVSYGISELFYR